MIDIFEILKRIDASDISYYDNLSIDEKKKVLFFLIQRWMTGTCDDKQILMINEFVNTKIFSLYKHQNLIYKLLCCSSTGKKRYKWEGRKKKENSNALINFLCEFYECSKSDAAEYANILDADSILEMAKSFGLDKDQIAKIKKDIKK